MKEGSFVPVTIREDKDAPAKETIKEQEQKDCFPTCLEYLFA